MDRRRVPRAAALAAATALLVGCSGEATDRGTSGSGTTTSGAPPSSSSGSAPPDVVTGLDAPWSIVVDDDMTLVSERDSGRVLEVTDDGGTREVGTVEGVSAGGEGGLLGLAVHDDHLYTYFTSADDNRVVRHELTGEPGSLALGDAETILDGIPSASFHNGGRIAFGPDDMLYVTTGDAGETDRAQDRESLGGKILRLTPEGEVPEDNPFDDSLVWTLGHRNPQGIAWDDDGTMYASEFGQDTWDELNVIEAGDNYGWPTVEGTADDDRFTDPVQQWSPDEASPSGIAIDDGSIWIANLRGERLREVPLDDVTTSTEHLVGEHGRLRDVAVATDGSLWVLTNNTDGRGEPRPGDPRRLRRAGRLERAGRHHHHRRPRRQPEPDLDPLRRAGLGDPLGQRAEQRLAGHCRPADRGARLQRLRHEPRRHVRPRRAGRPAGAHPGDEGRRVGLLRSRGRRGDGCEHRSRRCRGSAQADLDERGPRAGRHRREGALASRRSGSERCER